MEFKSKVPHAHTRTLSRSIEGGAGEKIRVAVFRGGSYDASMENNLTAEGFFAVAIKDPKPSDISEHPDFVLAPGWIRWIMPTPETSEVWVTSLGSSHDRNKLRKKLKLSHSESSAVRVEIKPLTVNDYKVWHENLYIPEIGGKTGAVLFWPKTEALSTKVTVTPSGTVAEFYRIFMYHKDGSLIGGALWSVSHSESSLTTRASAFEQKARAKYELAIRGMEESILFATAHGLRWVSYGTDPNFYGVDVGIGLQSFKASIGMKPVFSKVGSFQLVKILNKNLNQIHIANGEKPSVLIFAIGGNSLSDRVLNYQHLAPRTPKGNMDLLWSQDFGLTPIRFVADSQTPAINVPKGMILQNIVL